MNQKNNKDCQNCFHSEGTYEQVVCANIWEVLNSIIGNQIKCECKHFVPMPRDVVRKCYYCAGFAQYEDLGWCHKSESPTQSQNTCLAFKASKRFCKDKQK